MKNKLLISTALVAVVCTTDAFAQSWVGEPDKDFVINDEQTLSDQDLYYYKTIQVGTDGTLNISNSNIKTIEKDTANNDIVINGNLNLSNGSVLEAGNDSDKLANNSNMIIDGATVDMQDSDLEANGNISITNTNLTINSSSQDPDNHGIWADGALTLEGGESNLTNSYISADGDIIINGGNHNFTSSSLISQNGNITIKDGTLTAPEIMAQNGNVTLEGGQISEVKDQPHESSFNGTLGVKDFNIKGGTFIHTNVNAEGFENLNISGGTVKLTNGEMSAWKGNINISGGEITLTDNGTYSSGTGLYARKELNIDNATINMNGTETIINNIADYAPDDYDIYDLNINSGTINVNSQQAELSSSGNVNLNGGTINITEGSTLGIYGGNDKLETTAILGSAAILNIDGTLDTNLDGNGTLNFNSNSAKITGDVNLTDGGVMNIGLNNAVIDGDATFNSGSTLKLEIGENSNGSLQANTINGMSGSKLALNITKQMEIGDSETFELFKGTVTDNFTKEISNNRYTVTSEDGKNFKVTYENTASDVVEDTGGSVNNVSAAEAWDAMKDNTSASETAQSVASKLNDLSQNDKKSYVDALTAVAPETAPMVQHTQTQTANQVFGAVGTRLTGGTVSTGGEGMSSGDNIFERAALWVQGLFNHSELDGTAKAKGFDADTNGVAMGAEKYINDNTKVGLGYAYTKTDIDGFKRSTDVDTHTAFIYGEYKPSNWYVNAIASYGWSDYSEDKNVSGINVKADYDAETFGLQAMTGYDIKMKHFGLTPEVGLRYVHISQDGYTDSADQSVSSSDSDILTGVIGAKISKTWTLDNGINLKPEARIAATYDIMNDDTNSIVTLANGTAYSVEGDALDRFGMEFGAGLTADLNDNVEISAAYEGKFRQDYQDHTGLLNAKYKF